jgi:hypothetical protein
MDAIHNYNLAHGITEWGFEPANEPNIEWYSFDSPSTWPKPNSLITWQDMGAYFQTIWFNKAAGVRALTPPMAQSVFAEDNFTDANAIDPNRNWWEWCGPMRLEGGGTTGYQVMQSYYTNYNDGISVLSTNRLKLEPLGKFVGGQAGKFGALVGARVVVDDELGQQGRQFGVVLPGVPGEPRLEGAHEAFGDAIGLGSVRRDADLQEPQILGKLREELGDELGAVVADDELQVGRPVLTQLGHDLGGRDVGAGHE